MQLTTIHKLSNNYAGLFLQFFQNESGGLLKPMTVKDKAECKKSRFNKVKLSCLLFITVVKKLWRLKGVKGGKEAQCGKNICDFAFEFIAILWFFTQFKTEITATFCFLLDWFLFNVWGQKFGCLFFILWLFKCPSCLDLVITKKIIVPQFK